MNPRPTTKVGRKRRSSVESKKKIQRPTIGKFLDISGDRQPNGQLTAIEFSKRVNRTTYWKCSCNCGQFTEVSITHFRRETIKSCGHCTKADKGRESASTLTLDDADWIRLQFSQGKSSAQLAKEYEVSETAILNILRGKSFQTKLSETFNYKKFIRSTPVSGYKAPRLKLDITCDCGGKAIGAGKRGDKQRVKCKDCGKTWAIASNPAS